jgi:hypothetical protein
MRRKANDCPEGQHGPVYNVMGAGLAGYRKAAAKGGLAAMARDERQAYGATVEATILEMQRRHWFIVPGIILLGFYWGVSSLLNAGNDDGLGTMLGWLLGQVFFMIDTTLRMLFGGG